MPTTQKEFKDFERQYAAIRAANRDARREGVGLLTPKLLKEHIDSGKDLVLADGHKGLTVSDTPAELKQFVEPQRKASHPVGVDTSKIEELLGQRERLLKLWRRRKSRTRPAAMFRRVHSSSLIPNLLSWRTIPFEGLNLS